MPRDSKRLTVERIENPRNIFMNVTKKENYLIALSRITFFCDKSERWVTQLLPSKEQKELLKHEFNFRPIFYQGERLESKISGKGWKNLFT